MKLLMDVLLIFMFIGFTVTIIGIVGVSLIVYKKVTNINSKRYRFNKHKKGSINKHIKRKF